MGRSHRQLARALVAAAASSPLDPGFFSALGNSAIQGSQKSVGPFNVQILTNETHALVTLNASTAPSQIGYMAIGFGNSMKSADMFVTWPSADGSSWFVSARQASGHVPPQPVAAAQQNAIAVQPQLSTNSLSSKYSQVTFLRPLTLPSGFKSSALAREASQPIIYAASTTKPSGSDASATIVQHDDATFGVSSVDLSVAIAASGSATTATSTATPASANANAGASATNNAFFTALGNSQAIQGQQRNVGPFVVQMLSNETHAIVTLNASIPPSQVGYMAVGFGTAMKSADMVIAWPSADFSTWFVSARQAGGHVAPQPYAAAQQSAFTYLPQLSTNSSSSKYSQVSFIRALTLPAGFKSSALARASGQSIIYAASSSKPTGSDASATIAQHDDGSYGVSSLDLSTAIASAGSTATVVQASGGGSAGPWTTYDNIIVLHALCGSLAWAVIAPAAVLVGRLARSYSGWVRIHQLLQSVLTSVLTIIAFALGVVAMNMQGAKHFSKPHTQMGLVIFILLLLQVGLGYYSHAKYDKDRTKRPLQNVAHILLGVSLVIVGYLQVYSGMRLYARQAPPYVYAAWIVSIVSFVLAYLISCGRIAMFRRQEGRSWNMSFFGLGRNSPPGEQLRSESRQTLREKNAMSFFDQPVTEDDAPEPMRQSTVASREWAAKTNERMRQAQFGAQNGLVPLTLPLMAGASARPAVSNLQSAPSFRSMPAQQGSPVGAYPFAQQRMPGPMVQGLPSGPRVSPAHNPYRPREPAAWQQFSGDRQFNDDRAPYPHAPNGFAR